MNESRPLTLQQEQARIDAARDYYLSHGGQVQVLASYEFKPGPARKDWIDPETVLKRKCNQLTRRQREKLRAMADAL